MSQAAGEDVARGLMLVALGYGVISCADAAVKYALPEIGAAAAMVWRGVVGAAVVAAIARGRGLWPVNWKLLLARSLLHTTVSASWYVAWVRGVGLADSYAVAAVSPLLMTLLAIPMLGERVGWRRWASTLVGFAGAMFMLRPGGDLWRWETGLLLVATGAMAVTRIWTRTLSRTDTPVAIALCLLLAHIPVGLLLLNVPAMWPPGGPPDFLPGGLPPLVPSWGTVAALVLFGAANGLAHVLFARAFALAPIGVIAPFEYSPLIWGTLIGYLIWAELPAWTTLTGVAVVIAAGVYNLHRERVRRMQARVAAGAIPGATLGTAPGATPGGTPGTKSPGQAG